MDIKTWLVIALTLSASLNGLLYWLSIRQSARLQIIANNSSDLIEMIRAFSKHVRAIYSLESFYGDETLQGLMDHSRSLVAILEEEYGDLEDLAEEIEYKEEEEDGSEENQEEKHVLYAGTRRRNS